KLFPRVLRFSAKPPPPFRLGFLGRHRRGFLRFRRGLFRLNGPFFFCLGAFLFRGFFFGHLCSIDPFDKGHGSGVALALAKPHDARVTPIAIGRSRRDLVEQFLHRDLLPQCCQSIPSRVDRSFLPERHHFLRERSNRLRLGERRLDALVFDQRSNLIGQQRFAVLSRAAKLTRFFLVPHGWGKFNDDYYSAAAPFGLAPSLLAGTSTRPGSNFIPRLKPSCCSLSLISLSDFLPKLRYLSISASVFWASWPTVVIFALFKQFAARTLSSISFTLMLSSFLSFRFSSLTPAGVSSNSITSSLKFTKTSRWCRRMAEAWSSASSGVKRPSVQTSRMSLS